MKPYITASLLLVALATPALAAEHFAVVDTVGNCSVIDTKPSPYNISGLKVRGDQRAWKARDECHRLRRELRGASALRAPWLQREGAEADGQRQLAERRTELGPADERPLSREKGE